MSQKSTTVRLESGDWEPPGSLDDASGVWCTDPSVVNAFPSTGIDVFQSVDENSFWFDHRNEMVTRSLRKYGDQSTFFEIGSGSGVVAAHLNDAGWPVAAVEPIMTGAIGAARRGVPISICGDLASLELPDHALRQMGAFDVIEHIDDPSALLEECRRVLTDDGLLLITVPAHKWLWSDLDDWNGHFRRYTRRTLRAQLEQAGFSVVHCTHFFTPLVVPALLSRVVAGRLRGKRTDAELEASLANDLAPSSKLVSRILDLIHRPERVTLGRISLPAGTSILAVARPAS